MLRDVTYYFDRKIAGKIVQSGPLPWQRAVEKWYDPLSWQQAEDRRGQKVKEHVGTAIQHSYLGRNQAAPWPRRCALRSGFAWFGPHPHVGLLIYHMSHVCNHGTDQSDRRMNVARFCDLTCTFELWTGTCFASTESADSSHVRLQISALGRIFAISHGWKFLSFFRAKKLSFRVLFFRALPVRVEYRFHDDKHNLSW